MQCGTELEEKITKEKAELLSRKFNLTVKKGFRTKTENTVNNISNSYLRQGTHRGLIIEVRKKGDEYSLIIRGSLHKFYHHNNNGTFSGFELVIAIEMLCKIFLLNKIQVRVLNIEIGVNLPVWFKVYEYLKLNLLYHKKKVFKDIEERAKFGFKCIHDNYLIKLYNKGNYLMRYEVKYTSSVDLKEKYKVEFLSDITPETINNLVVNTCAEFENVVMRDGLNVTNKSKRPNGMTDSEINKIYKFSSKNYLSDYYEDLQQADLKGKVALRQLHHRLHVHYKRLINKYGNGDHARLMELIIEEAEGFLNSWNSSFNSEMPDVTKSPINKKAENVTIDKVLMQDCNNIYRNKMKKQKSKKQVIKDKREQEHKRFYTFINALTETVKKIDEKKAA
jgi:hypothetical protein